MVNIMKKLMFVGLLSLTASCGASTAVIRAGAVQSANNAITGALASYKIEGLICVDKAVTRGEAEKCIDNVEARYKPVWYAWDKFRRAKDQATAWCELAKAMPSDLKPQEVEDLTCP